jgi:cytochrome b561
MVEPDQAVADAAKIGHFVLFVALALLLLVHIAAALRHHLVARNEVLTRMLRGTGRSR